MSHVCWCPSLRVYYRCTFVGKASFLLLFLVSGLKQMLAIMTFQSSLLSDILMKLMHSFYYLLISCFKLSTFIILWLLLFLLLQILPHKANFSIPLLLLICPINFMFLFSLLFCTACSCQRFSVCFFLSMILCASLDVLRNYIYTSSISFLLVWRQRTNHYGTNYSFES